MREMLQEMQDMSAIVKHIHQVHVCLEITMEKTVYWNEKPVKNYYGMFDTVCLHDGDRLKVDAIFIYC